jgi:serine/threonine-protein kinase
MSPEQVKDARKVDPRTDLWSASVMTWEMLTGRVAFPAPTEYARLTAVTTFTPDTLAKVDPQLAGISPIIERAMQKDPALRFASALEMARALPAVVTATSAPPTPDGLQPGPNPSPLSRLPTVPSIFGPGSGISPGASSERRTPIAEDTPLHAMRGGGSTLQSAAAVQIPTPLPPRVLVIDAPAGSTMPSYDLPVLDPPGAPRSSNARAVAAWLVVVLVLGALAAGFVLGFAVARSM